MDDSGSIVTPIYQTATFGFTKAREVPLAVKGKSGKFVYTRWDNPTTKRLERKLASFESAAESAFFSSGMAAISTAALSFVKKGDHVVTIRDLYGETFRLMKEVLPRYGVQTTFVDTTDVGNIEEAVRENTRIIYVESPTNPTLKLVDISLVAKVAHRSGAMLLVDNTFASPINQKPIELGADLVLHSATKYLNGHADVVAGAVVGGDRNITEVKMMRRTLGGTLDPHAAWLVLRGMKTMALRVRASNENAQALAEFLSSHKKVAAVHYPGLKTHPQHELARKQMKGFGGMLSFELEGNQKDASRFVERLNVGFLASSLGGVETLVSQPALLSHHQLTESDRRKLGIPSTLVRVSVGIEDKEDLIEGFRNALAQV